MFVGDTIEYRTRVADKVDLKSRPDRGLLVAEAQGRNQHGEIVFAITSQMLASGADRTAQRSGRRSATRLRLGRFGYPSQGTGRRARPRRVSVTRCVLRNLAGRVACGVLRGVMNSQRR